MKVRRVLLVLLVTRIQVLITSCSSILYHVTRIPSLATKADKKHDYW